jgi:hypothetical protein
MYDADSSTILLSKGCEWVAFPDGGRSGWGRSRSGVLTKTHLPTKKTQVLYSCGVL